MFLIVSHSPLFKADVPTLEAQSSNNLQICKYHYKKLVSVSQLVETNTELKVNNVQSRLQIKHISLGIILKHATNKVQFNNCSLQ